MSGQEWVGSVAIAGILALLLQSLLRMRPLWPYLTVALLVVTVDVTMRQIAPRQFTAGGDQGHLVYARNPATRGGERSLDWPNRAVVFVFVTLAIWLTVRPRQTDRLIGIGLALVVPAAGMNLVEPLLRGWTTDYLPLGDLVVNLADLALILGLVLLLVGVVTAEFQGWRPRSQRIVGSRQV